MSSVQQPLSQENTDSDRTLDTGAAMALSRGFALILWSIPLGILLFPGRLLLGWRHLDAVPAYLLAALLFFGGLFSLSQVRALTPHWNARVRRTFMIGGLLAYFAPFTYWWQLQPQVDYLTANVFALLLACSWMLWAVNGLVEEWAVFSSDKGFRAESRLSAGAVIMLLFSPLTAFFYVAVFSSLRHHIPLYQAAMVLEQTGRVRWMFALMLGPVAITILLLGKARKRALQALPARPPRP